MLQKVIIKSDQSIQEVLKHEPQKLVSTQPENIDELIRIKELSHDFLISDIVKNFTGLAEVEEKKAESEIERKALEELKAIQEKAYSEAYELGLEEGRKKAFFETSEDINKGIQELNHLISSIRNSKIHFLNNNENQLLKMTFYLAGKIALFEIENKSEKAVLEVLKECVSISHSEEKIKIGVAPEQFDFLETLQKEHNREYDFLKRAEFLPQNDIRLGGCVITTNYSEIDARIEERIEKLWVEIQGTIPPLKIQVEQG